MKQRFTIAHQRRGSCKQWVRAGESAPKKVKTVPSFGKVMGTYFWDSHGVLLIDYRKKDRPIIVPHSIALHYWTNWRLLLRLNIAKRKAFFPHDNAPPHTSLVLSAICNDLQFEELTHASYSQDLAPSDCFLFPNTKKLLGGQRFFSIIEFQAETAVFLQS